MKIRKEALEKQVADTERTLREETILGQERANVLSAEIEEHREKIEAQKHEAEKAFREKQSRFMEEISALTQSVRRIESDTALSLRLQEEKKKALEEDVSAARRVWAQKHKEKSEQWLPVIGRLRGEVELLEKTFAGEQARFEAEKQKAQETLAALEKEEAHWREKTAAVQAEREKQEKEERRRFDEQCGKLSEELRAKQQEASDRLKAREEELQRLNAMLVEEEQRESGAVQQEAARYQGEVSELEGKVRDLQLRLRTQESEFADKLAPLQKRRSEIEMELAMKSASLKSEELRFQREAEKNRRPLEQKVRELERKLAEEEGSLQSQVKAKESLLKTLQTRLQLRLDRSEAERNRRAQQTDLVRQDLSQAFQQLRARLEAGEQQQRQELETRVRALAELERALQKQKDMARETKEAVQSQMEQEKQALEMMCADLERRFSEKRETWERLLAEKDAQVRGMVEELESSDRNLQRENELRQRWTGWTNEAVAQIRQMAAQTLDRLDDRKGHLGELLQKGIDAYSQGRHVDALTILARCIEIEPTYESAWQYRVLCLEALGMADQAREAARMVLQINPGNDIFKKWLEKTDK